MMIATCSDCDLIFLNLERSVCAGILSQSWLNAEVVVPGLPQPHLATQEVLAVALKQRLRQRQTKPHIVVTVT